VPSDFLTPRTTFSLNGTPYESLLGGSPDDPLIRLLARGAAGYRTAAKALQYAVREPLVSMESVSETGSAAHRVVHGRVTGHLRDTGEACDYGFTLTLSFEQGQVLSVDAVLARQDLERIAVARRSE
jgi:hypothetical protein